MFPIVGWEITVVPAEGMISVRIPYLAFPYDKLTETDPGKHHAMHVDQAREIRDALTRMIQRIDDHDAKSHLSANRAGRSVDSDPSSIRTA